jgi:hypothetical protein
MRRMNCGQLADFPYFKIDNAGVGKAMNMIRPVTGAPVFFLLAAQINK